MIYGYEERSKSFLVKKTAKNATIKLRFDIVIDVSTTKVDQRDAQAAMGEKKTHNQKIDALIAEKEDEALKGKSVAALKKMRM